MLKLEEVTFTGTPMFTENGTMSMPPSPYVGEPSPEIDEAWDALISGIYLRSPRKICS